MRAGGCWLAAGGWLLAGCLVAAARARALRCSAASQPHCECWRGCTLGCNPHTFKALKNASKIYDGTMMML